MYVSVVRVRVIDPDITVRWPGEPRHRWPAASCQLQLFTKLNEMSSIMAVKAPDNRIVFKVKSWLVHWTNKSRPDGTYGDDGDLSPFDSCTNPALFKGGRLCPTHGLVPTWFENVPSGLTDKIMGGGKNPLILQGRRKVWKFVGGVGVIIFPRPFEG